MGNPDLTIRNTEITGNSAGTKGGGVDLATYKPCVRLVDCTVSGNTAKAGEADLSGMPAPGSSNSEEPGKARFGADSAPTP